VRGKHGESKTDNKDWKRPEQDSKEIQQMLRYFKDYRQSAAIADNAII
jgi:hypothetical protein